MHAGSPPSDKVVFYAALFAARSDAYAVRWDNTRSGKGGWMPAVRGGRRRGLRSDQREYLHLTPQVITEHLSGDGAEIGLYPMLDGDRCHWLAADFYGPSAMLDALAYVKAARAVQTPVALEVSRSGAGADAWLFFSSAVPAATARHRPTARGNGPARPDESGQLRPVVPFAGRLADDTWTDPATNPPAASAT